MILINNMVIFMKNILFLMSLCSLISIQNVSAGKTEKTDNTDFEFKKPGNPYRPQGISKPTQNNQAAVVERKGTPIPQTPLRGKMARRRAAEIATRQPNIYKLNVQIENKPNLWKWEGN